ncbi:MAG: M56 family metallopeptidase [Verrucomicrobiales bacterium]|nr:M56 family metallopeptidase [Verrucomicrobiales bacterium]
MNTWMNLTHDWLFRTTLEGSVLILTVLALSHFLGGRLGPRWRVVLWTLVGLKLLVPAFMPAMPGLGNWFRPQKVESAATNPLIQAESIVAMEPVLPAPAIGGEVSPETGELWPTLLVVAWGIGAILFGLAILWRQRRFEKRAGFELCRDTRLLGQVREVAKELGVCQDFRTVFGPAGGTPAVCGVTHTRLVLPRDWEARFDPSALRLILMHELEHIRRHDVLQNWLAALVNAVHWFNPIVWIAVSRFQSDRELLCDARTLSRLGPSERFDYGRTLLRVQSEFLPAPAIAGVAPCVRNHPTLQQRIQMITNPVRKNAWLNALLIPGVAGIMAVSFGSATADEPRPPQEGERPRGENREEDRPREGGREEDRPREGGREGDRPREGERPGPRPGEIAVFVVPDGARMGDRFIPNGKLRGELIHMKAHSAIVSAEPQVPFHQVNQVVDALRDAGIRDIRIGGPGHGPRPEGGPREGGMPRPEGGPREGGMPRPEGGPRDGDKPRPEGGPREGGMPRPEGGPREGDRPRPEGGPRDGDKPRPEGGPRDGDKPRPEGGPRDGDKPRPEGGPRDGDKPRPEGGPRDGDKPRPEGEKAPEA